MTLARLCCCCHRRPPTGVMAMAVAWPSTRGRSTFHPSPRGLVHLDDGDAKVESTRTQRWRTMHFDYLSIYSEGSLVTGWREDSGAIALHTQQESVCRL